MDRTAWIVVALCVIGLVLWEVYFTKQMQPRPRPTAPAQSSSAPSAVANFSPSPSATVAPVVPPPTAASSPSFAEKIEPLRNSDAELRLTNRGGALKAGMLLHHIAEKDERVILNSVESMPIGAVVGLRTAAVL